MHYVYVKCWAAEIVIIYLWTASVFLWGGVLHFCSCITWVVDLLQGWAWNLRNIQAPTNHWKTRHESAFEIWSSYLTTLSTQGILYWCVKNRSHGKIFTQRKKKNREEKNHTVHDSVKKRFSVKKISIASLILFNVTYSIVSNSQASPYYLVAIHIDTI